MILVDMDMPKSCFDCDLCNVLNNFVLCHPAQKAFEKEQKYTEQRHENCPIEEYTGGEIE